MDTQTLQTPATGQAVRQNGTASVVPLGGGRHRLVVETGTANRYDPTVPMAYRPAGPGPTDTGTTGREPADGTRTGRPVPDRTGTGCRPAVWTRDSEPPGPEVTAVFDGAVRYRRTSGDRWVPDGQDGPGFGWAEIPAGLRVDASRRFAAGDRGPLVFKGGDGAAVCHRPRPRFDLPQEVLDYVDLSPAFSASWVGVARQ